MNESPAGRHDFAATGVSGVSIPPIANVTCTPHRTPAGGAADVAFGGSGHTDTTNSCPTHSASDGDLRGNAVRLVKRRKRHGLRRRYEGQGKGNSNQPDH